MRRWILAVVMELTLRNGFENHSRSRRLGARGAAHRRAHRGGHLHRLRHPRLPRPAGRLDQESARREDVEHPLLSRRCAGAQGVLAEPHCRTCGGILKSDTISFGQQLVPEVIDRAMQAANEGDLFLAVGSSLQVYPIAGTVEVARAAGSRIVIVNAQPTPFDDLADAVLPGSISEVLPRICARPLSWKSAR